MAKKSLIESDKKARQAAGNLGSGAVDSAAKAILERRKRLQKELDEINKAIG